MAVETYRPQRPTKFCHACGSVIDAQAVVCPPCGVMQPAPIDLEHSEKRILPAFLLCFFVGFLGVHRFYAGKVGTGVLQLLTLGGLGIWVLIDLILIVTGSFRDADGDRITSWT